MAVATHSGSGFTVNRVGRLAVMFVSRQVDLADSWSRVTIGTLPAGWRPIGDFVAPMTGPNNGASVGLQVSASGKVEVCNLGGTPAGNQTQQAVAAYVTA